MLKRILTTVVGVAIFILIFFLDSLKLVEGAIFFNIGLAIVSLLLSGEFYKALENKGFKPIKIIGYLCSLFILPIGIVKTSTLGMICATMIPLIIFLGMCISVFTKNKYNITDVAITTFGAIYSVLMTSFVASTRALPNGAYLVWFIFGGAWGTDTMAYLIGRSFGKHKLTQISPKKSIEGCIAGVVGSLVFYVVYALVLKNFSISVFNDSMIATCIIAIIVSIVSQLGDLAASSIKRYVDIKDFSNLMPGHGGMLDRFDSILFVSPVVYYALYVFNLFS